MDYMGRKPSLLVVSLPHFFGYFIMVCAHLINHPVLFKVVLMFGRFLTGVGIGWTSSVMPVSIAREYTVIIVHVYMYRKDSETACNWNSILLAHRFNEQADAHVLFHWLNAMISPCWQVPMNPHRLLHETSKTGNGSSQWQ